MNINEELDNIIFKYHIDRHYPVYRDVYKAKAYLTELVREIQEKDTKVIFISNDRAELTFFKGFENKNISMKYVERELLEKVKWNQYNEIYLVSYENNEAILEWFAERSVKVIWIYNLLENKKIYMNMNFYEFTYKRSDHLEYDKNLGSHSLNVVYEYCSLKRYLEFFSEEEICQRTMEKMFFLLLYMKNFSQAEEIIKKITNPDFLSGWKEISRLLDAIKDKLHRRQEEDIVVYWLDALSYEKAQEIPYLQERRKKSVSFAKAYNVTPYTNPTFRLMFCGMKQVDDLGYREHDVNIKNSELLAFLKSKGYKVKIIGRYFNPSMSGAYEICGDYMTSSCSSVFWNMIDEMLKTEERTVYIAHAFAELHGLAFSSELQLTDSETYFQRYQYGLSELNNQLKYYDELIGNSPYRIYMSDHGDCVCYPIKKIHVLFQVYHEKWKEQNLTCMFSLTDFPKIVKGIIENHKIDETILTKNDYILFQDVDIYNKAAIQKRIREKRVPFERFIGYKGLGTQEYVYWKYRTGEEYIFKWSELGDTEPDYFGEFRKDRALLEYCRERVGDFPEDLKSDEKFEYSRYVYKAYENVKHTVQKTVELLVDKLSDYEDGSIALRTGGRHSYHLYQVLPEQSKRKIGCIIDNNKECVCNILPIPIIAKEERLPEQIRAVLLSSHNLLKQLKQEADKEYTKLDIIDIYAYFSEHGYRFQFDFYEGTAEDYDVDFPFDATGK